MNQLKPYSEYKDSGIEWLGEIPAHWELKRAKDVSKIFVPQRDKPELVEKATIPWITTDFLLNAILSLEKIKYFVSNDEIARKKLRKVPENSILTSCVGEFGLTAINRFHVIVNQQIQAFTKLQYLDLKYANYFFQSSASKCYFDKSATETTIRYLNNSSCG